MTTTALLLDGCSLTLPDVDDVARGRRKVAIKNDVVVRMQKARVEVDRIAAGSAAVYGINTGFGALAERKIDKNDVETLQYRLIQSHAVGVGAPLSPVEARALMLLRANTLAVGHSGCRPLLLEMFVKLLNADVAPYVPSRGSVGASGDLAPLSHVALLLIGDGDAYIGDEKTTAAAALAKAGVEKITLKAKEGLALINGTQAMCAVGGLALVEAKRLATLADITGAMTLDALRGTRRPFDARIHLARPHKGQQRVARNLHALLDGSEILESHVGCAKVQDPYSLRCMPQVHGATRDTLGFVDDVLTCEINSATDNPLVFLDGDYGVAGFDVISGGNFHGQPVALVLDYLAIAVAELANISERRVEQLLNPALSDELPAFLTPAPGLNSGFMILQVSAASLVNENKVFAHPASVDSIPSSANREDHVSMGMTSANKAMRVVENTRRVLGIELLCAAQAIDLRRGLRTSAPLEAVHRLVRSRIPFADIDRAFRYDLAAVDELLIGNTLIDSAISSGVDLV